MMPASAQQMDSTLFTRDYKIDRESVGDLELIIDNIAFFKDNEWNGSVTPGYTLPGIRIQPKVRYTATPDIMLEAGLHSLIYSGTTKYPNSIYRDIAVWKGTQYHSGTHLLPYFRAQARIGAVNFILGNIYGGSNHRLIDPMFSAELNTTADPETGLQMYIDTRHFHLDTWANWESFIFRGDTHRESFVFGLSTQYLPCKDLKIRLGILAHHRGGELDTITVNSINTVMNGSFGLEYRKTTILPWLRSWSLGADVLGYVQQSGKMWPVDKGWALHAEGRLAFPYGLNLKAAYLYNRNFVSILSYPYYGCMSMNNSNGDIIYKNPQTINVQFDWVHKFTRDYSIGVRAEMFNYITDGFAQYPAGTSPKPGDATNFSFGLFMRATPSFKLFRQRQ